MNFKKTNQKKSILGVVLLIILATAGLQLLNSCKKTPLTLVIKDEKLQADDNCDGDGMWEFLSEDGKVQAKSGENVNFNLKESAPPTPWCHGFTHKWIGECYYKGFQFISDPKKPMIFKVDKTEGYYYISGKGTVITPDGQVFVVPQYE